MLAGLFLVLHTLWPRFSNSGLYASAVGFVLIYSLVYAFTIGLLLIGSRGDYGHCEAMIQSIAATAPIPPSAFSPTQPAVSCLEGNYGLFRTRYQILQIYGVSDPAKQDLIVVKLKQIKNAENTEAMQILLSKVKMCCFGGTIRMARVVELAGPNRCCASRWCISCSKASHRAPDKRANRTSESYEEPSALLGRSVCSERRRNFRHSEIFLSAPER